MASPENSPSLPFVPDELFHHVEQSHDNGLRENALVEVMYSTDPDKYWIARIERVCGPVLRLRHIGGDDSFWCDMNKMTVHHLGWCKSMSVRLVPPPELEDSPSLDAKIHEAIVGCFSPDEELLAARGLPVVDSIPISSKIVYRSDRNPNQYWIATIMENISGRLSLHYDTPDDVGDSFWTFYLDPRIQSMGYCDENPAYTLKHPNAEELEYGPAEWDLCIAAAKELHEKMPYPKILIQKENTLPEHDLEVGMKLEVLDANTGTIRSATVMELFSNYHFGYVFNGDENKNATIVGDLSNWSILPHGWCQNNDVDIAPSDCTHFDMSTQCNILDRSDASSLGFLVRHKLEAADPTNPSNISSAYINRTVGHMLYITLEYSGRSYWYPHNSMNIFPVGWCAHNDLVLLKQPEKVEVPQCSAIYYNYKCATGPFINKNKLSKLPKCVGPGDLRLVIKEVLNMIISVAYKPAKLLKDLEYDGLPSDNVELVCLKAKLKTNTFHGMVKSVKDNKDVPQFCREMCSKLQACPNLFGPIETLDNCSENCSTLINKPKILRRRGRRRGLHFMTIRARERRAAMEAERDGAESGENENESEPPSSPSPRNSEAGTRPNTPDSNNSDPLSKKQTRKRVTRSKVPPMEMKTRGAKLPNFAIQMKQGHWNKKDVETIYNNTCVVPRKQYSDDSDSDNSNTNSTFTRNNLEQEKIYDVSDSEEPELKKLLLTHETNDTNKLFNESDSSVSANSFIANSSYDVLRWTIQDVYDYFASKHLEEIATKLREECIDGWAVLMLNMPTAREHLRLQQEPANVLCQHVSFLQMLHYSQNSMSEEKF